MIKQRIFRKNLFRDIIILSLIMTGMPVILQKDVKPKEAQKNKIIQVAIVEKPKEIIVEKEIIIKEEVQEKKEEKLPTESLTDILTEEKETKVYHAPKVNAPKPVSYEIENNRLVCAKDNDRPEKSKKRKRKHMDMECCLDPDEYPNPHCHYSKEKYGKYL